MLRQDGKNSYDEPKVDDDDKNIDKNVLYLLGFFWNLQFLAQDQYLPLVHCTQDQGI